MKDYISIEDVMNIVNSIKGISKIAYHGDKIDGEKVYLLNENFYILLDTDYYHETLEETRKIIQEFKKALNQFTGKDLKTHFPKDKQDTRIIGLKG